MENNSFFTNTILQLIIDNPWKIIGALGVIAGCIRTYYRAREFWRKKKQDKKNNPVISQPPPPERGFKKLKIGSPGERVGRDNALNFLEKELINIKHASVAIVSFHGAGGMGKTFLAHVFKQQHPEIFFLEIPVGKSPAYNAGIDFLAKLNIDTKHVKPDNIHKILEQTLAKINEHGILVLDDVWNFDVQVLIPDLPKWKTLITSRNLGLVKKFTSEIYELREFTCEESIQLFKKVLKEKYKPDLKDKYLKLSDHLANRPYGIRLLAEYLKRSLTISHPDHLLNKLKTEGINQKEICSLELLLEECIEQLKTESEFAHDLLYELCVCSDQGIEVKHFIDWQSSKASKAQIEHELEKAADFGLVLVEQSESMDQEVCENKIRIHTDLLNLLRKEDSQNASKSFQKYLHETLVKNPTRLKEKISLQNQIVFLYSHFKDNFTRLESIYSNFFEHLYRTGRLQSAYSLGKYLIFHGEHENRPDILAVCYGNQALILSDWGKLDQAMKLHKKQEKLCKELGDKAGLSLTYGNQALILKAYGKLDQAMELHKKEEKLCEELGDKAGLSRTYGNQGLILKAWGQFDDAMELHKKEEKLCEELGDKAGLSRTYGNQGLILKAYGKLDQAMDLHKKQEKLKEELGDKAGLSACYGNQGLILSAYGKLDQAMELHKKQEKLCEELHDKVGLSRTYGNQGLILKAYGKLDQAMDLYKKEEKLKEELGDKAGLSRTYGNQALILKEWGKLDDAMELFKKIEKLFEELHDKAGLLACYWNMGVLLREMNQDKLAIEKLQESIKIQIELRHPDLEKDKKYLEDYISEIKK